MTAIAVAVYADWFVANVDERPIVPKRGAFASVSLLLPLVERQQALFTFFHA